MSLPCLKQFKIGLKYLGSRSIMQAPFSSWIKRKRTFFTFHKKSDKKTSIPKPSLDFMFQTSQSNFDTNFFPAHQQISRLYHSAFFPNTQKTVTFSRSGQEREDGKNFLFDEGVPISTSKNFWFLSFEYKIWVSISSFLESYKHEHTKQLEQTAYFCILIVHQSNKK